MFTKAPYNLFRLLYGSSEQKNFDRVCSGVVSVLIYKRLELDLFEFLVKKEIEETVKPSLLFRANSLAMRTISCYAKLISEDYLKNLMAPFINDIIKSAKNYEIRLEKIKGESTKTLEKNQKNLKKVKNFFYSINFICLFLLTILFVFLFLF